MTDSLIERMTEIAHRDSAVSVTVLADDLRALLSKLRAPVADERAANPHIGYPDLADAWQRGFDGRTPGWSGLPRDVFDATYQEGKRARAALASAQVDEPETMDEIHRREREHAPWVLPKDPTLPGSAPVADDLPRKTHEFELRAMSTNYTQGHCWDHLDAKCTAGAADEIRALRAALASAPVADHGFKIWKNSNNAWWNCRARFGVGGQGLTPDDAVRDWADRNPTWRPASTPVADPTDPGHDVNTLREHVRHLERRVRQLSESAPVAGEAQKGWRLVPEKLTEEMRTAGEVVRSPSGTVSYGLSRHALALAWDALLSAAPSPPATHAAPQASEAVREQSAAFPARPLGVFCAGKWTLSGTGQAFSHTDLDEAAFVAYRDALSAQPGAQKNGGGDAN